MASFAVLTRRRGGGSIAPMPADDASLLSRSEVLQALVAEACERALFHFHAPDLAVQQKADRTPVTAADLEIESLLRRGIRERFPHDSLLGEEHGEEAGTSGWRWVIDPIDGTISFARGVPLFGILVGLEHGDEVLAGICAMPAIGETVSAAAGRGAWLERRRSGGRVERSPLRVGACGDLAEALVCVGGGEYFRMGGADPAFAAVHAAAGRVRGWCDCHGGVLAASGRADGWVDPLMHPWDAAPFPVIFAEAGGVFTDWRGRPGIRGGSAVAGNPVIHAALLETVRRAQA